MNESPNSDADVATTASTTAPKSGAWWLGLIAIACVLIAGTAFYLLSGNDKIRRLVGYRGNPANEAASAQGSNSPASASHPLGPALELADQVLKNIRENVHDYTATVIKQERIGGQLKPEEICYVKIRSQPFSAYMKFLSPADLQGQEAIYVAGANGGNLIAHAPPGSIKYKIAGKVSIAPTGMLAMM